jgi:hypothetical protein
MSTPAGSNGFVHPHDSCHSANGDRPVVRSAAGCRPPPANSCATQNVAAGDIWLPNDRQQPYTSRTFGRKQPTAQSISDRVAMPGELWSLRLLQIAVAARSGITRKCGFQQHFALLIAVPRFG